MSKKLIIVVIVFVLFASIVNINNVNALARGTTIALKSENATLSNPITIYFGQSDSDTIAQLSDLDLAIVASMDESQNLPKLRFESPSISVQGHSTYVIPDDIVAPDSLLLYSNGYYGNKLKFLSDQMGLNLDEQKIQALEAIAATKGVNTRYLLTLVTLKNADKEFDNYQDWLKWLYIEVAWVRSSLFVVNDEKQVIQFISGESVVIQDEDLDTVYRTIFTSLSAGRTKQQAETLTNQFFETYKTYFGGLLDETLTKPQVNSVAPFLYKPYNVSLQGRGYYDHTYPSVDNGGTPNVGGMLDYLGRTNTNYDTHDGDDFWIPRGSQVIAPQGGQVVYMYDGGAGNKGIILYYGADTSYELVIWHLNSVSVSLWQWVSLGQLLGTSGYAGGQDHVHFEVRHGGKQTDTMGWYGGGSDPCPGGPGATGKYKGCEASSWLWADENPPDFVGPTIMITQQPVANQWYNTDQNISWTVSDSGSGVRGYKYSWDQNPPTGTEIPGASNSILLSSGGQGTHTLFIQAWDNSGNSSTLVSVGPLKYDTVNPSGSLAIQNGSLQTYSTTVELNTQASDATSGVSSGRFRDVGGTWSAWFSYPGAVLWQLIGSHGQTASVEAQFKDGAGNVSTVVSDSITINLYPVRPSSTLYVLKRSTFGAVGMSSDSPQYILNGTAGQPSIPGIMQGTNYRLSSGYWASSFAISPFSCTSVAEITQTECEALVSLYNSTAGASWTNHTNWLQTNTPCTWYGITCSAGHVTEILLANNSLIGNIPSALSNFPQLTRLLLHTNQLSGTIPSSLGNLHQLNELRLGANQLSGSIPVELGNLSKLTMLGLRDNQLTGVIPSTFGSLSQLTELSLNGNILSGYIPVELGNLNKLITLDLHNNQLSGAIPSQLGNLVNLEELDLSTNQLTGFIPAQLGTLTQLQYLYLCDNQLTGSIPSELGNLGNLIHLWLDTNHLSGELPSTITMLTNLTNFTFDCWITTTNPTVIAFVDIASPGWQDFICPVVKTINRTGVNNPTDAASVDFTVTFSEAVQGVDPTDFHLAMTGGISGASVLNVAGGPTTYTVTVSTGTGSGTLRLDVVDDDTIMNQEGNLLGGIGSGNGDFSGGAVYTIIKTYYLYLPLIRR